MPWQLSGGQMQRVAIARALVNEPSIILADEPTGNLDSRSSHVIMEELAELHKKGNTIIMVTHNPNLTSYASRVINMLDGKIASDTQVRANTKTSDKLVKIPLSHKRAQKKSDKLEKTKKTKETVKKTAKKNSKSEQTAKSKPAKKRTTKKTTKKEAKS